LGGNWLAALLVLALLVQSALAATAPLSRALAFDPLSALCGVAGPQHQDPADGDHGQGCCSLGCTMAARLPAVVAAGIAVPQPLLVSLWLPQPLATGPPLAASRFRPGLGARAPPQAA
jgi:hypothetical protein